METRAIFFGWTLLVLLPGATADAIAAHGASECQMHCPRCHHVCKLTVDQEKESRSCFIVECEPICIPPVTFPWEKCCPIKPARVKHVRVLKSEEYECERCRYRWTAKEAPGCGCAAPSEAAALPAPATTKRWDFSSIWPTWLD